MVELQASSVEDTPKRTRYIPSHKKERKGTTYCELNQKYDVVDPQNGVLQNNYCSTVASSYEHKA